MYMGITTHTLLCRASRKLLISKLLSSLACKMYIQFIHMHAYITCKYIYRHVVDMYLPNISLHWLSFIIGVEGSLLSKS